MTIQPPMVIYNGQPVTADVNIPVSLYAYKQSDIWITVTAVTGSPTSGSMDINIARKHPREGTDWIDVPNSAIATINHDDSFPVTKWIRLTDTDDLTSENIRIEIDVTFSGGTSPGFTTDITAINRL